MIHLWVTLAFAGQSQLIDLKPLNPPPGLHAGEFDGPPAFQWKVRLPGGLLNTSVHAEHTRAVAVGTDGLLVGSAAGDGLYLLARRDGSVVRHFPAGGNSVESEPLVDGDRVWFTDVGGNTWSYGLAGQLIWRHRGSAPALVRPTRHQGLLFVTDVDDLAVALDAATGELIWRYQHRKDLAREAELSLYAAPPAVVRDNQVLLGFSDGTLMALDHDTGEVAWTERVGEGRYPDLVAEPTSHGSDLYVSGYYRPLVALDAATQEVRWRLDHGGAAAAVVDTRTEPAIIYHPGSDGKLRAVSALTGAERWTWDSESTGALTTPVITPAGVVVASSQGSVYLVDHESGAELWRYHERSLLQGVSSAPLISERQLFFISNAGYLYSFVVP